MYLLETNKFSSKTKIRFIFTSFVLLNIIVFVVIYIVFLSKKPYDIALSKSELQNLEREVLVKNYLEDSSFVLQSLRISPDFKEYLNSNTKEEQVIKNIKLLVHSKNSIMQFRFLDKNGFEKIRVDRYDDIIKIVAKKELQDKSKRNYFQNAKNFATEKIFFSDIDLNNENGKIENPFRPTIRGILPIMKGKEFEGILIINFSLDVLQKKFFNSEMFHMMLVDGDGYTLSHYDKNKSWGRYQKPQIKIEELFPNYYKKTLTQEMVKDPQFVSNKLNLPMVNKPILILELKKEWKEELEKRYNNEVIVFFIVMVLLAFLFSLIIYQIVNKLNLDLLERVKYEKTINDYVKIIDSNVITSKTDLEGKIIYTSEAFCKISGYSKEELIGKKHSIVRHPDMCSDIYKNLWQQLLHDKEWDGEIQNRHKNGTTYWVYAHITPIFNEKKEKIGYVSVREDITYKKELERISTTDALSEINNKRSFYMITPKYIESANRENEIICFVLIDIDNFKLYNDTYGHLEGDKVIKSVATVFKHKMTRGDDFCFRVGGEEFALLFKTNDMNGATEYVEDVKKAVEDLHIEHKKNSASSYVTVSMGMLCIKALDIKSVDEIYKQADNLLYKAKESGRNKVVNNITLENKIV